MSLFQDGGPGIISRRKVLPPGEWTRSIARHLCSAQCSACSWSTVHSYLLQ